MQHLRCWGWGTKCAVHIFVSVCVGVCKYVQNCTLQKMNQNELKFWYTNCNGVYEGSSRVMCPSIFLSFANVFITLIAIYRYCFPFLACGCALPCTRWGHSCFVLLVSPCVSTMSCLAPSCLIWSCALCWHWTGVALWWHLFQSCSGCDSIGAQERTFAREMEGCGKLYMCWSSHLVWRCLHLSSHSGQMDRCSVQVHKFCVCIMSSTIVSGLRNQWLASAEFGHRQSQSALLTTFHFWMQTMVSCSHLLWPSLFLFWGSLQLPPLDGSRSTFSRGMLCSVILSVVLAPPL